METNSEYNKIFNDYSGKMIGKMILNGLMNSADKIVAALFIGANTLVATTLIVPVLFFMWGFGAMFVAGLGSYVGLLIGKGKSKKANEISSFILLIILLTGLLLTSVILLFSGEIAWLLGARGDILVLATDYLFYLAWAFTPMLLAIGMDALILNDNSPKYSFIVNMISMTSGFTLNLLMVVVFKQGIVGLALATVISSLLQFLAASWYFLGGYNKVLAIIKPTIDFKALRRVCFNGSSELFSIGSEAVMMYVINIAIVTFLSPKHLQAYATISIFIMFIHFVFMGAVTGLQPFLSQQMGAGKYEELKGLFRFCIQKSYWYAIAAFLLFIPLAKPVFGLLLDDSETISIAFWMYLTVGFATLFSNVPIQASSFFTAINRPIESSVIAVLRTLLLLPIVIWLAIMAFDIHGIGVGFFIADGVIAIVLTLFLKKLDLSRLKVSD